MKAIIFDVDGTIWDATPVAAKAWNESIQKYSDIKVEVTEDILADLFGKTMQEINEALFPYMTEAEMLRIAQYCHVYENELLETEDGLLYDGIRETIETLHKTHDLYIVSNCQAGYIEVMLRANHLGKYFIDHLCWGDTNQEKSYTIRKLMDRNNLTEAVYIGDTKGDADACAAVGIPFVFAAYGFGQVEDAKWIIEKPTDLIELIKDF